MLNELPFLVGLLLSYFNKEPSLLSFLSASFFSKTFMQVAYMLLQWKQMESVLLSDIKKRFNFN